MSNNTLWAKGYTLNSQVENFITGQDYILDHKLVKSDVLASIAHAHTLVQCNILSKKECTNLIKVLKEIFILSDKKKFKIKKTMEDCHTAIELTLTTKLGDAGKKIHTGRSRNDQVQVALRLYYKESLLHILKKISTIITVLLTRSKSYQRTPMPGRTHLQIAMPSTVGLYLASYAEQLLDDTSHIELALQLCDRCPLGSAAGYGVPLPLDRTYTSRLLGFSKVHNNVIAAQNSRGRIEQSLVFALEQVSLTLSRFSEDFILFTLPEFNYFSLPQQLCSGSSIMPQKKNPDVLELLRASSSVFTGHCTQLSSLLKALPSGYQRDLQLTKFASLDSIALMNILLPAAHTVFETFEVQKKILHKTSTTSLFATDEVYRLVKEDKLTFRDAYQKVSKLIFSSNDSKKNIPKITTNTMLKNRTSQGSPGKPNFSYAHSLNKSLIKRSEKQLTYMQSTLAKLITKKNSISVL